MSYLRDVCADKGHVCPSTAVEGTDAIRLYTCSNRTRLRGDRAAFYFTSNDSSKQALCPDGSPVFGAALLSQCFLPVRPWLGQNGENLRQVATIGLETRKRRTDRRYDIFFITPFVPNTANEYQLLYRPRDYFARVGEKRRSGGGRGLSLSPPFLFFLFFSRSFK